MSDSFRHQCTMCGGSCHGAVVSLSPAEAARTREQAAALGLPEPTYALPPDQSGSGRVGLRKIQGRCIFQGEDALCKIHGKYGATAKPQICQQFPLVAIEAEDGTRVGIDPACYTHLSTWRSAAPLQPGRLLATRIPLADGMLPVEQALIAACLAKSATLGGLLGMLCGEAPGPTGLPAAFADRLARFFAQAQELRDLLAHPDTPPMLQSGLAPMLSAAQSWQSAPNVALSPDAEAYALDAIRRTLWLRLSAAAMPSVPAVALLATAGIQACAWAANGDEPAFGHALAAWLRALRDEVTWQALAPTGRELQYLARGI